MERVFVLAAEAGFEGVEVLVDERWDTRQEAYLRRLREEHELPICSLHSPFARRVDGWESGNLAHVRRTVELAQRLNIKLVIAHLPWRWHEFSYMTSFLGPAVHYLPIPWAREQSYRRWLLDELAEFEAKSGVQIGVENMPCRRLGPFRYSPCQLNDAQSLSRFPHVTLDTTHFGTWGADILAMYETLRVKLVNVHLSNYNGKEHRLPWDGQLPLAELLRRLRRDGYAGNITVELHPEALGAGDDAAVLANLRKIVGFCR